MVASILVGMILGVAEPEPRTAWLSWEAPPTCPDTDAMAERIAARLGRMPEDGDIEVSATVVDDGPRGLHLDLQTRPVAGPVDARRLEAHDCGSLADAAALLVALSVDPVAVAAVSAARAETEGAAAVEPEPLALPDDPVAEPPVLVAPADAVSPAEPSPEAPRSPPVERSVVPRDVLLSLAGGPEIGALPGVAGGATAAIGLGWTRLRIEVGATWIGIRTATDELASVRVQMAAAVVRACARIGVRRIEVPLCGGVDLGAVRGAGREGSRTRTAVGPWIAPHVVAGVHGWVRPRLAIVGRVDVAVPVWATAFVAQEPGPQVEVFRTGSVSARFWVGLETKFGIGRDGSSGSRRMDRGRP